jgi:hypothetical protein
MQAPPLNQPFDLKIHTGINQAVKIPVRMFERQCVGIGEVLSNEEMEFGRERHECGRVFPAPIFGGDFYGVEFEGALGLHRGAVKYIT